MGQCSSLSRPSSNLGEHLHEHDITTTAIGRKHFEPYAIAGFPDQRTPEVSEPPIEVARLDRYPPTEYEHATDRFYEPGIDDSRVEHTIEPTDEAVSWLMDGAQKKIHSCSLSVTRHHTSHSRHRGVLGNMPTRFWNYTTIIVIFFSQHLHPTSLISVRLVIQCIDPAEAYLSLPVRKTSFLNVTRCITQTLPQPSQTLFHIKKRTMWG